MPTNKQRITGAIVSVGITVSGAWLASAAYSQTETRAQVSFENGISITFNNIRNNNGNVVVIVFADRDAYKAYDVTKAVSYREIPAEKGSVTADFHELKTGPYVVAAFHDEDGNQDLNMDGEWPTEGYATSGAVDAYDTPTFRSASLDKDNVSITMYYTN